MAGYATKLVSIQSGVLAAVAGITAANGYSVTVKSTSSDLSESPWDRSVNEFPRAYVYMPPDDAGTVERTDRTCFIANFKIVVDVWVHLQKDDNGENLTKYADAVVYAVEAWQAASTIGAEMDVNPGDINRFASEKNKWVQRVVFSGRVSHRTTDRA